VTEGSQPPFRPSDESERPEAQLPGATPAPGGETPPSGGTPPPYSPPPAWGQPSAQSQYQPQPGQQPLPPGAAQPGPPGAQQGYYAYPPPPGYGTPYPGQQPYYPPPGYPYAPVGQYRYDSGPDNGLAIASLTVAILAIVAMFFTAGFAAPISIVASIVAVVLGLKGKKAVEEGRTRKHRDVAVAGFWTGIAGIVLAVLAIVAWVLVFVFADTGGSAAPGDLASLARTIVDALAAPAA
jgi:hypothetical protein